jgi:hypothetical protein
MEQPLPTEIFEAILAALDMRDLLLAQRVNRQWRDVITASPALQQKLFMQPIPPRNHSTAEANPLLESIFPAFFRHLDGPRKLGRASGEKIAFDDQRLNRLFCDIYNCVEDQKQEALRWLRDRPALLRQEASWRRMFAAQPPPRTFVIDDECCVCLGYIMISRSRGVLGDERQDQRLRLGVLYDMMIFYCERTLGGKTPFSLDWFLAPLDDADGGDDAEARDTSTERRTRPAPAVLVRNVKWSGCSGDSTPGETGVKIADFDTRLIQWVELDDDDLQEFSYSMFADEEEGEGDASNSALQNA